MRLKNILLSIFALIFSFCACAQSTPPNIDFETGTTAGWTYYQGGVSSVPVHTLTACPATYGVHTLTTGSAVDTYGHFPVVAPGGGSYSLKLGNKTDMTQAQRARYYVHVPTGVSNYSFIYHYATVLQDPGHLPTQNPAMMISAFDSVSGIQLPCDSFCYTSVSIVPGFLTSSVDPTVYYKSWDRGTLNLAGWGGHTIAIDFTTNGCVPGGHFGYGYIDVTAGLFITKILTCGAATDTLTAPPGYATYRWCDSATFGTTIATTASAVIPTPGVRTCYAVILTPYAGYGCTDTLYTVVIPVLPCTGTPAGGYAYAGRAAVCADPDTLTLASYSFACGLTFQWQSSPDNMTWANIPGATLVPYTFHIPNASVYYRCQITCINSGLSAFSTSTYVPATGPVLYSVINPPVTTCNGADFYVSTCWTSPSMNVTSYYGDGTSDNTPLSTGAFHYADIIHNYAFPGSYSVKQVLYDGLLPMDSVSFSFNYLYCSTLPVKFYWDNNNDCVYDRGDNHLLSPVKTEVDSNGVPIDTVSSISGFYYRTYGAPGTVYSFRVLSAPIGMMVTCPSTGIWYDTIQPYINLYPVQYIGLNCDTTSNFDLREYTTVRCGMHLYRSTILIQNYSCHSENVTLTMNINPRYTLFGSTPAFTSHIGSTFTWDISSLLPNAATMPQIDFQAVIDSGPFFNFGDTIHSDFMVTPFVGDIDTNSNICHRIDTAKMGNDPNYIEVSPPGCIPSNSGITPLQYTVVFENTGNDTAHNIHVMDTLSDNVNPKTLEVVAASAEMNIALFNDGVHNIVKFDFPNINLLDSSHHGQCDGMVIFNIKTKDALPDGATIDNRAGIYFDINDVVMTNTVENTIGCPDATTATTTVNSDHKINLYPNPAKDELTIKMDKGSYNAMSITNQVGQQLIQQTLTTTPTKINIKTLPAGLYYITFKGDNGTRVQKFVKM